MKFIATNQGMRYDKEHDHIEETEEEAFQRDSPIVLYMAVIEILACGACALTAASMYQRRRHQICHPSECDERIKRLYLQVPLAKDLASEDTNHYGIGFRPSTDGLECLMIESIRWGSIVDYWNRRQCTASPEELIEQALGDNSPPANAGPRAGAGGASASARASRRNHQVEVGAAIVAVNDVHGDVGLMQAQLLKPQVTLWIRAELSHASNFEESLAPAPEPQARADEPSSESRPGDTTAAEPVVVGQPQPALSENAPESRDAERGTANPTVVSAPSPVGLSILRLAGLAVGLSSRSPRCVCVALEDEEPQILTRWLTCSLLFGWVTMLPVLFMQPHEDRPRQQLFRQFLLKPCLIVLPIWVLLWFMDCIQVGIDFKLIHPFYYFGIVHMVLPGVLFRYLMLMQAADEQTVLDQRTQRVKEANTAMLIAVEDPSPTLLKELIMINPVALVWLGSCASIPIVAFSLLTPMQSERAKLAQQTVGVIYSPLVFLQMAFIYTLWNIKFENLPKLYLAGFGLLLSVPCFLVWCLCIVCSSKYGRQDLGLVRAQRIERAKAAKAQADGEAPDAAHRSIRGTPALPEDPDALVDCSEAQYREWEFIYTA
jgi:hypothetical protein